MPPRIEIAGVNNMLARDAAMFAFDALKGACVVRMAIIQTKYVRTKSGKARPAVINFPEGRKWASLNVLCKTIIDQRPAPVAEDHFARLC